MTSLEILKIKAAVRFRDGYRCTECGLSRAEHYQIFGIDLDVHRLVPGSPYCIEGAVTLCRTCHQTKPKSKRGSRRLPNGKVQAIFLLPKEAYRALRAVALEENINMGEFLFEVLQTDNRYREALERIRNKQKSPCTPPPPADPS
jgi:hypothetical protein